MKERVYAWYPPASDVLMRHRDRDLDTYTKECLYRYTGSRFHEPRGAGGGGVRAEATGKDGRAETPAKRLDEMGLKTSKIFLLPQPPPGRSPPSATSKSAVEDKLGVTSPEPGPKWLERGGSSFQMTRGRASSSWIKSKDWLPETSTFGGGVAVNDPAPVSTPLGSVLGGRAPQAVPTPPASRLTSDGRATRVQSAVIRRQGLQLVKRSVQSAGPERQSATLDEPAVEVAAVVGSPVEEGPVLRRPRPRGPTPRRWREEEDGEEKQEENEGLGMDIPLDYDEQLKMHGWKMEIPGDPFRLKRGCIGKRLSTTVVIPVEEVARKAVPSHFHGSETFFYNTIPRMPMSFTIHPDWVSEVFQTKPLELKAKTGTDGRRRDICRMADFSFVY